MCMSYVTKRHGTVEHLFTDTVTKFGDATHVAREQLGTRRSYEQFVNIPFLLLNEV
jgi:hypothetical protein